MSQPWQHPIQATSVTCAAAWGNTRSLTHWAKPGIEPAAFWRQCQVLNPLSHNGNSRTNVFSITLLELFVLVKTTDLISWMDLCFRCCQIVVKNDCICISQSVLWAEGNKYNFPCLLPQTDMCYSVFQKVTHRSGLPKCADIVVLAEVGAPFLIFQKNNSHEQADSKIFHSCFCDPVIPCLQSTVRMFKKKLKSSHLIWVSCPLFHLLWQHL